MIRNGTLTEDAGGVEAPVGGSVFQIVLDDAGNFQYCGEAATVRDKLALISYAEIKLAEFKRLALASLEL